MVSQDCASSSPLSLIAFTPNAQVITYRSAQTAESWPQSKIQKLLRLPNAASFGAISADTSPNLARFGPRWRATKNAAGRWPPRWLETPQDHSPTAGADATCAAAELLSQPPPRPETTGIPDLTPSISNRKPAARAMRPWHCGPPPARSRLPAWRGLALPRSRRGRCPPRASASAPAPPAPRKRPRPPGAGLRRRRS